jgi:hypothetical protein
MKTQPEHTITDPNSKGGQPVDPTKDHTAFHTTYTSLPTEKSRGCGSLFACFFPSVRGSGEYHKIGNAPDRTSDYGTPDPSTLNHNH